MPAAWTDRLPLPLSLHSALMALAAQIFRPHCWDCRSALRCQRVSTASCLTQTSRCRPVAHSLARPCQLHLVVGIS